MTCLNPNCCENLIHTAELKACKICKKPIKNWNCSLCEECATEKCLCGHCLAKQK